jgi:hypothetical protein
VALPPIGKRRRWTAPAAYVAAILATAGSADAAPQANFGLTVGGAATDLRADGPRPAFHLGARADVLFLRNRNREMAVGPYVDVATAAFDTIETGGGVEWLVPVSESIPFVLSAGLFERHAPRFGWEPGAEATIFAGSRSHNFTSWYGLAAGVFVQGRYGFGDGKQADLIAGAQIDLSLFAYPFLFAYEALRR